MSCPCGQYATCRTPVACEVAEQDTRMDPDYAEPRVSRKFIWRVIGAALVLLWTVVFLILMT